MVIGGDFGEWDEEYEENDRQLIGGEEPITFGQVKEWIKNLKAIVVVNTIITVVLATTVGYFISVAIAVHNEKQQQPEKTEKDTGTIYHVREPKS